LLLGGQAGRSGAAAETVPVASAAVSTPADGSLLLIDGTRLRFLAGSAGRPSVVVLPSSSQPARPSAQAASAPMTDLNLAGRHLAIPADALPFLGRGLDPSLFDLDNLRRLERGGRLPVRISYAGQRPAVPGVTITQAGSGFAEGYLTAASARRFGAALTRLSAADHARASYGTDGLFARGVSIGLAGVPAPRPVSPDFPMHTLTVHGLDLAGKPDTGDEVLVFSADNTERFGDWNEVQQTFRDGIAKYSVPTGHYWAFATFLGLGATPTERVVILPQFTVKSNHAAVRVDERSATSQITVSTPRPAVLQFLTFDVIRGGGQPGAPPAGVVIPVEGDWKLWVSPTHKKPTVGSLRSFTQATLLSPPGPGIPYAYSLDFPGPAGRIPTQHLVASKANLATVNERYFQDVPSAGGWAALGGTRAELNGPLLIPADSNPLALPGRQTQYLTGNPAVVWSVGYFEFRAGQFGGQGSAFRSLRPGHISTGEWNRYPLHPQPIVNFAPFTVPFSAVTPSAARAGDVLTLLEPAFGDNTPGHIGPGLEEQPGTTVTGHWEIDQDGTRLASGGLLADIKAVHLSPQPSVIKFTQTSTRTGPRYLLSPSTTTTWIWRSRREAAARVPVPWVCRTKTTFNSGLTRQCAVQPMLTLNYRVAGLSLSGATPPGPQVIGLTVGHLQLASQPAISDASIDVSFDDGATWQPADVQAVGAGQYRASFTAPAGSFVTLRATAKDKAGGSIQETIERAYQTTSPARTATSTGYIAPPCATQKPGDERCFLAYRPQPAVNRAIRAGVTGDAARPHGLGPQALRDAYRLPNRRTSTQTVAISIPFHTPGLAHFLAVYRKHYGLRPCTVASGCFRQVNQDGKASPPEPNGQGTGWDLEATLDVSMVSAACPHCHILVVEAQNPGVADLAKSERTAARLGAQVISNSYGINESAGPLTFRQAYHRPGHTYVASSGDLGFTAAQFPADLSSVVSVGGTALTRAPGRRGWRERAWNQLHVGAGGSGCSAWVAKPAWQHDRHCPMRTSADVSAVASNVTIFNPTYKGWLTVSGTSVSAPLIAGIIGLAGNGATFRPADLYRHANSLFDITTGNNSFFFTPAQACGNDYLCVAKKHYDAPTGLGTPDGTGAF
jgi:hypothetical protein